MLLALNSKCIKKKKKRSREGGGGGGWEDRCAAAASYSPSAHTNTQTHTHSTRASWDEHSDHLIFSVTVLKNKNAAGLEEGNGLLCESLWCPAAAYSMRCGGQRKRLTSLTILQTIISPFFNKQKEEPTLLLLLLLSTVCSCVHSLTHTVRCNSHTDRGEKAI